MTKFIGGLNFQNFIFQSVFPKVLGVFTIIAVLILSSAPGLCQDNQQPPTSIEQSEPIALPASKPAVGKEISNELNFNKAPVKNYKQAMASAQKLLQESENALEKAKDTGWPKPLENVVNRNIELATKLLEVNKKAEKVEANIKTHREKLAQINDLYEKTSDRVASMGLTPVVGALLQKQRRILVKLDLPSRSAVQRRAEVRHINEEELYIEDLKERFDALDSEAIDNYLAITKLAPGEKKEIHENVTKVIRNGQKLADNLTAADSHYLQILGSASYAERALRMEAKKFSDFITINLIWTKNNQTFGLASVTFLDLAVMRFLNPENWISLGTNSVNSIKQSWLWWSLILLIPIGWFGFYLKRKKCINTLNQKVQHVESDSIVLTLEALGVAILYAGAIPLLIYLAGYLLGATPGSHMFTKAVSLGLTAFAKVFFFAWITREILRREGLGQIHFGWDQKACRSVSWFAWWVMILIAPLVFLITVMNTGLSTPVRGSLGRILFMLEMVVLAIILIRLFRPQGTIFAQKKGRGFLSKIRGIWLLLSIAIPISIMLLAYLGYYRTAVLLENDLISTIALVGALIFLNALFVRWGLIARHRRQSDKRNKANTEGANLKITDNRINSFIKIVIAMLALFGLYKIWGTDIPIAKVFNAIVLWSYHFGEEIKATTLGDMILCFIILGFTFLIAKNLSGVLETVIFKRLHSAPGNRHAITLIFKYIIVIVGITLALGSIGITWSKFQWLLAALTVGLGFGLQDVVANFVSGVIILFERPITIGDTVTIGSVSGKVSKIHIRATTITDWDRKEVIIPNKTLLTSDITNWSLSDQLTRAVIPVGVAYGSDAQKTEELLLRAAKNNPLVVDDPPPSVIFTEFGDSSLDFKLRVFAQNKDRMTVIHQLHLAINEAFNKEGLEIPFPQHDVHLDKIKPLDVRIIKPEETT